MSKRPCYTCGDEFIKTKRQFLYEQTIQDATEFAQKNTISGFIAIIARSNGTGFTFKPEAETTGTDTIEQLLHFINGTAVK